MLNHSFYYQLQQHKIIIQVTHHPSLLKFMTELRMQHLPQDFLNICLLEDLCTLMEMKQIKVQFQEENLQIVIVFNVGSDYRFIYLRLRLEKQEDLLNFIKGYGERDNDNQKMIDQNVPNYEEQIKQLQSKSEQLRNKSQILHKKSKQYEQQIVILSQDCNKLHKNILIIDDEIMNCKQGRDLQNYRLQTEDEEREQRKKIVHLNEIKKLNNPHLNQIINGQMDRHDVILQKCDLKSMKFIEIFKNLKQINLKNNLIRKIESLATLTQLHSLQLGCNRIQKIEGLDHNIMLKYLSLQFNKITKLQNIFHLTKLQIISLSGNNIEEIPTKIQSLQSLIQFRIVNNKLNILAPQIAILRSLKVFSILGNPCFNDRHKQSDILYQLCNSQVYLCCADF